MAYLRMKKCSRQKNSVDLSCGSNIQFSLVHIMGLYNHVYIMVCAVYPSIFLLYAMITRCKYRSHAAGTVLMLQVPFFICKYLLPNLQVPCSTRQQTNHGTVLFTPDLLTPHTAFLRLHASVPVF